MKCFGLACAVALMTALILIACSSDGVPSITIEEADAAPAGGSLTDAGGFRSACAPPVPPTIVNAACTVTIDLPGLQTPPQLHLPEGTAIDYCTNPPSSGAHYPIWADFTEITHPIPWPYLVHDEEHGAILLLYNCPETDGGTDGCPDLVAQLRAVRDRAPADPLCTGTTKRFVIVPAPSIPSKIALAAWGATLTADCIDAPTFDQFVKDHYGKGPELLCAAGELFP